MFKERQIHPQMILVEMPRLYYMSIVNLIFFLYTFYIQFRFFYHIICFNFSSFYFKYVFSIYI